MAARRARDCIAASGLVIGVGNFLFALFNAIFFVGPFSQVDHFATLAAKGAKAISGVPYVLFPALRA
jgi:hypothetical protein